MVVVLLSVVGKKTGAWRCSDSGAAIGVWIMLEVRVGVVDGPFEAVDVPLDSFGAIPAKKIQLDESGCFV